MRAMNMSLVINMSRVLFVRKCQSHGLKGTRSPSTVSPEHKVSDQQQPLATSNDINIKK